MFFTMIAETVVPAAGSLEALLADIGLVLSAVVVWLGTVVSTVVTTPILLISFCLGLAFSGVALYFKLRG